MNDIDGIGDHARRMVEKAKEIKPCIKPLPCPFCGHDEVYVQEGDTFRWRVAVCGGCDARAPDVRVQTIGDGTPAIWEKQGRADAIAAWNKRVGS
jgi:Lar family restriction alleviation protein